MFASGQKLAGIKQPLRIKGLSYILQCQHSEGTFLRFEIWNMVEADAMLVGNRPAMR
jgi:hypothetical protein